MSYYTDKDLDSIGLKSYGENVKISTKTSLYFPELISIGNNVRIDDFCILSENIILHNNIHISAYCALYGSSGITMYDFSGVSARTTIYSCTDDFSGEYMIGPHIPETFTNVFSAPVVLERYVQIGGSCVVMPGVTLKEGSVIGALSFVNKSTDRFFIYAGIPCTKVKPRNNKVASLSYKLVKTIY